MDETGLPLAVATDCVGCNELLPSRVDRGDHARFEKGVRVDEGGSTSIVVVVVRTGNARPGASNNIWISGGDWRPFNDSDGLGLA